MIRIIAGTFGFKKGKRIVPYTAADGAVDLGNPELEARLVKKGIAVYTGDNATPAAQVDDDLPGDGSDGKPEYNRDMKLAELAEIAKAYGVDASGMRTKDAVIAAIEEATAAQVDDEPDDGEDDNPGGEPPEGEGSGEQPDLNTANPEVAK